MGPVAAQRIRVPRGALDVSMTYVVNSRGLDSRGVTRKGAVSCSAGA